MTTSSPTEVSSRGADAGSGRPSGIPGGPGRPGARPAGDAAGAPEQAVTRQFVTFSYYRFTDAYHALSSDERAAVGKTLGGVVNRWQARSEREEDVILRTYSLAGIRADVDWMVWFISEDMGLLQGFSADLQSEDLGRYVRCEHRYLSQTKRSQYIVKIDPEHGESRTRIFPGNRKYIFVYPFEKTREWYLLSKQARQGIMDEHIEIGTRYRSVKLNTTYSFGLDDQEFVVAFETDHPGDFLDLVQALRETESSRYTKRDTPIYTCVLASIDEIVGQFGGGGRAQ